MSNAALLHAETFDFTFPTTAPTSSDTTYNSVHCFYTSCRNYWSSNFKVQLIVRKTGQRTTRLDSCSTNYLTLNSITSWHNNHPWHTTPSIQSQTLKFRKPELIIKWVISVSLDFTSSPPTQQFSRKTTSTTTLSEVEMNILSFANS